MSKEFAYTNREFNLVRQRLRQLAGINLSDSKDSMVYSRLVRRIRALRLTSFKEYLDYLETHKEETEQFINALTTNLTSFFREAHHFDYLHNYLVTHPGPLTIWCAACSSGEEAYSIAMTCVEARKHYDRSIKILASDIDSAMLAKASAGIYPLEPVQKLSLQRKKQFFHRGKGANSGKARVGKELRQMIQFFQLNLLDAKWAVEGPIDIIFCRNVMIYFDKQTQLTIVERMVRLMNKDGLYFAGHSENFSHISKLLKPLGQTVYQPNAAMLSL